MATFALLASPLLGSAVWRPVAGELERRGNRSVLCGTHATSPAGALAEFAAQLPDEGVVLVAHSNAGAYVPGLTTLADVRAIVFVDAVLPPAQGQLPLAPPGLLDHLRALADADGVLPPWTQWWDDADVDPLFPDAESRAAVESEQSCLPIGYFTQSLAIPAGWDARPCAYLALSATYLPNRDAALERGWAAASMDAGHLHQLVAPSAVADAIVTLLPLT